MSRDVATRYAGRSLFRHARRTVLSILGIGVASGLSLFMVAFVRGESQMMLRAASESGIGHLRIIPRGWLDSRDNALRLPDWQDIRDRRAQVEETERRLRALEVEADLAAVPEAWRQ